MRQRHRGLRGNGDGNPAAALPYFEPRANQFDLRVAKSIRVRSVRILPTVDVYNIFNAVDVGAQTLRYGPLYRVPSDLKGGRLLKFGAQLNL